MSRPVAAMPEACSDPEHLPPRTLWLLEGTDADLAALVETLAAEAAVADWQTLYVPGPGLDGEDATDWPDRVPGGQLMRRLGHSVDRLVLDWRHGWQLNHLSQAAGCVRAGGQLVILLNPNEPQRYGWQGDRPSAWFAHWRQVLLDSGARHQTVAELPAPTPGVLGGPEQDALRPVTADQAAAVADLKALAEAPPGAGCLITAPRGHGKTVALALAAAELSALGYRITVLAAQQEPLSVVRDWLHGSLAASGVRLATWDQWMAEADEAAMLGVPRLRTLLERAPRLACVTTTEGYEGSGQGFLLRFLPEWQQRAPSLQHRTLQRPVRWAPDDPLRVMLARALLYPVRSAQDWLQTPTPHSAFRIAPLQPAELLQNPALCEDWVHLLTTSHYQTRPDDLRQCLDNPDLVALGAWVDDRLVGLLLALREPPLDDALATAVWEGTRRPNRQLAKQSLVGQLGHRPAAFWSGWRIWRLVVHPGQRRRGVATELVSALTETTGVRGCDYLATAFGLTAPLLAFWCRNGFHPVRLGHQVEAASGERALLMVQPRGPEPDGFTRQAMRDLGEQQLLHVEQAQTLAAETLLALARTLSAPEPDARETERLRHWCASRQPEQALRPVLARALWRLVAAGREPVDRVFLQAWVQRLWHDRAWADIQHDLKFADRHECVRALRQALAAYL